MTRYSLYTADGAVPYFVNRFTSWEDKIVTPLKCIKAETGKRFNMTGGQLVTYRIKKLREREETKVPH